MPNPPPPTSSTPDAEVRVARRSTAQSGSATQSVNDIAASTKQSAGNSTAQNSGTIPAGNRTGKPAGKGRTAADSRKNGSEERSMSAPLWFSCATTELGHVRKVNEDAFLDAREQALWVVADGMGGHSRGDRASQAIIETMHTFKSQDNALQSIDDLLDRLNEANDICRKAGQGQVMGSTVAALYLNKESAYVLWAGDSRIYRHRHGKFSQLTDDHSLVQELCRLGELTPEEAENHPSSNVITRAIGVSDDIDIQVRQIDLEPGDRFLLCSDGLFKDVKPAEVASNLALPSPRQALDELVKLALRRGGTDNVTAIVVQMAIA